MVDAGLVLSAALMGAAGIPHCVAMCGASSSAATRSCTRGEAGAAGLGLGFQLGRVLGYAAAGALAASSVAALGVLGEAAPVLRPLWTMLHVAALAAGLWLLWRGTQPAWMSAWPMRQSAVAPPPGWQRVSGPVRATVLGTTWVAWPCGLLQSALIVAALASTPAAGAAVMAVFALASSPGLWAASSLWLRLGGPAGVWGSSFAVRLAGFGLAAASAWALGHGLWERVAAFCAGP